MSNEELNHVTQKEWDDMKEEVSRIAGRTSRWAGGLSVLSFFILAALGVGVSLLSDIAQTVDSNQIKLAAPRYTKEDDNAIREEDWARYGREQAVRDEMFQRELDRRQIWIHEQDQFRIQMVEFAAETRGAMKEMRGLIDELKKN